MSSCMSHGEAKQFTASPAIKQVVPYPVSRRKLLTGLQDITECWLETDLDVSRWLEEVQ